MKSITSVVIRYALSCAIIISISEGQAQNNRNYFPPGNREMLLEKSVPGFYYFKEEMHIPSSAIFESYGNVFGLTHDDEMRVIKTTTDEMGNTHTKYRQFYKDVPVEVSMLIVHTRPDRSVYLVNGNIIRQLKIPSTPVVNETDALELALQFVPAKKYLWQDESFESIKKATENNPEATYFPKGKLCIYPTTRNSQLLTEDFSLGWEFDIYVLDGSPSTRVFVDALDGTIKNAYPLGRDCTPGTANTIYNGNQTITTKLNGNNYNLINDCQGTILHTFDVINDTLPAQATEFVDADNNWSATNQRSPTQTQYSTEQTYKYYSGNHNRLSWNGSAGPMNSYHGLNGISYANACWGCIGNSALFGIGPTSSDSDDWNTLDIVGHEYTHGVDADEVGMPYYAETGALDESNADIFGEMIEQWTEGWNAGNAPWLVGEDRGNALRSMWNPNAGFDPDTYEGTYWFNVDTCIGQPASDNCGVHTNSGVQNYWYFLVAHGGFGTNDNGEDFTVAGLGNAVARNMFYQNLTVYQTPTSEYLEQRNGTIQAAEDLYGVCSNATIQVAKAWFAVGADVNHNFYNKLVPCFSFTSNNSDYYSQGIRSLTLSNAGCQMSTATSTNFNIYLMAGIYVSMKYNSQYIPTGTTAIIIKPSDCSYTVH